MTVKLIAFTQPISEADKNPMSVLEQAACMCYDSKPTENYRIAEGCYKSGHTSVYEHINFVFEVKGVSRALLAQLTRHRHLSFTVRSQRYCDESDFGYEIPAPFLRLDDDSLEKEFTNAMDDAKRHYQSLKEMGAKSEDARAVLPNACETSLVVSANARALINTSGERLCNNAQHEIRSLFMLMRYEVNKVCPEIAAKMLAKCDQREVPYCSEHKCCGRHPKLKDLVKE